MDRHFILYVKLVIFKYFTYTFLGIVVTLTSISETCIQSTTVCNLKIKIW